MKMKKLFVSVPMKGRTEEAIKASIAKMKAIAEIYEGEELELIDSYIPDMPKGIKNLSVWCLGRSIQKLSEADVFMGITNNYEWNGCCIEYQTAERYGIKCYGVPSYNIMEYHEPVDYGTCAPCKG